jgi:hypothetical protein
MKATLLIRATLLLGVLLFGGVTWFVRRSGDVPPFDPANATTLLWVARGVWGLSMATCLVLFGLMRNARSTARVRSLSIVGWASGELVAMMGGVVWFLTGNSEWYAFGLVYLVLAFLAFPARGE